MNNSTFKILLTAYSFFITGFLFAGNPLIKDIGMSDPHVRVFNDTIYLFSGHDDTPTDKLWVMKDWRVFKSTDLINWTLATTISPAENYMDDASKDCWAADAATRNGKYYFYFSDQKRSIGVMMSNSPNGPYIDALGKPLVAPMHDPTLFVDDDANKTPYLVYGDKAGGGYRIAKVNDDMISLAEPTKSITVNGALWENAPKWQDKNYLFKYNGTYYLSWGSDYATSKNVYGPYECVGSVGKGFNLNSLAHGSFFWWKGQFYHIWTYYINSAYKYRECIITYCHFDNAGKIVTDTDFLTKHFATGMGQYDATWPEIEAEWFYEKSPTIQKQDCAEGGFELTNIENNSWVRFVNVDMNSSPNKFSARIGNIGGSGSIEIRLDSLNGELLGEVLVPKSANASNYISATCNILKVNGKHDVYLHFKSNVTKLFNLNKFSFSNSAETNTKAVHCDKLNVFPNPSTDGIFNLNSKQNWKVLSNLGQSIACGQSSVVDLSDKAKGIYLLLANNMSVKLLSN